ncbi:MAG: Rdx family protein [Actinomycetota bacterium]|nr:Rdx family protein [Actinomycetota bacterium]
MEDHGQDIRQLTIVPSSGGVFEVDVDGERIYSKRTSGRHIKPGEILKALRERGG